MKKEEEAMKKRRDRKEVIELAALAAEKGFRLRRARRTGDPAVTHHTKSRGWLLWSATSDGSLWSNSDIWFPNLKEVREYLEKPYY